MTMSTKITSSSPRSYLYLSCNGSSSCRNQDFTYNLPLKNRTKKINQSPNLLKFSSRYGFLNDRAISRSVNLQPKASSASPGGPSSSWKKWLVGILLTVILPAVGHKGGLWVALRDKINKTIQTVEQVAEVVEEIAEEAEKIVEEVEEKLPGDSQLKETLDSFDSLAKQAVKEAKKAEDIVHKVKDVEEEIEETLVKARTSQQKK